MYRKTGYEIVLLTHFDDKIQIFSLNQKIKISLY